MEGRPFASCASFAMAACSGQSARVVLWTSGEGHERMAVFDSSRTLVRRPNTTEAGAYRFPKVKVVASNQ